MSDQKYIPTTIFCFAVFAIKNASTVIKSATFPYIRKVSDSKVSLTLTITKYWRPTRWPNGHSSLYEGKIPTLP